MLLLILCRQATAESISVGCGYAGAGHQYLNDVSIHKTSTLFLALDTSQWRIRDQGLMARGPVGSVAVGSGYLSYHFSLPAYHFDKYQGVWMGVHQVKVDTTASLTKDREYLSDTGSISTLREGTEVQSQWSLQRYTLYWKNQSQHRGPVTWAGIYQEKIISPSAATFDTLDSVWFDGEFIGNGLILGREKDGRGLNFQWHFQIGEYQGKFSANQTNPLITGNEQHQFGWAVNFRWHYRYYLKPYWYLVPALNFYFSSIAQSRISTTSLSHSPLNAGIVESTVSLQRRF